MKENILGTKSNKSLNSLSKAIIVISKIVRIFIIIGIIGIVFTMIILGLLSSKIKIKDNEISIKGVKEKITVIDKNDSISFKIGDQESEPININIKDFNKIINEQSVMKLTGFIELSLLFVTIDLLIGLFILNLIIKIFKNTMEQSPFVHNNVTYIKKIGYYLLTIILISIIGNMVMNLLFGISVVSLRSANIILVLFVFALAYIFEYGNKLENNQEDSE